MLHFTDITGRWQSVRGSTPLPVAGGQVLHWLSDDFNSAVSPDVWGVTGAPAVANSELTVTSGQALLSKMSFQPPCLVEAVITMTARASTDDFRIGFYRDNDNLVEWRAAGTTAANMDAVLRTAGVDNSQTAIDVGAANNTYRMASIYVGVGEILWFYRPLHSLVGRAEVRRILEHSIPDGPFRIRLAGLAGTSTLKVHRVQAYQLADIIPPGALGHHVEAMALPVRVVNGPFGVAQSNASLGTLTAWVETVSSLAAGATATTATRAFLLEQCHLQGFVMGDQPFTVWLEWQLDGSNWAVAWHGNSIDANPEGTAPPARYYAATPILQLYTARTLRWRVKNTGTAAGTFRFGATVTTL